MQEEKYKKIDMLTRVDGKNPPKLIAMDINDTLIGGIASETLNIIERTLNKKEQVLFSLIGEGLHQYFNVNHADGLLIANLVILIWYITKKEIDLYAIDVNQLIK